MILLLLFLFLVFELLYYLRKEKFFLFLSVSFLLLLIKFYCLYGKIFIFVEIFTFVNPIYYIFAPK